MTPQLTCLFREGLLLLEPYTTDMVTEAHVAWLNNPEIVQFSEQRHYAHTIKSQQRYIESFPEDSHIWLIREEDVSDVGTITAYIDRPNQLANMGILIGQKSIWGRSYGLHAWELVMDFLLHAGIRKIEAGCMASNKRMANLLDHAGFSCEAVVPNHFLLNKQPQDMLLFGIVL